jgi:hypothetical protein
MSAHKKAARATDEVAAWDVWSASFVATCRALGFAVPSASAADAAISEAFAADFILRVLRESRWLRWRFPRALSGGVNGPFARWLRKSGPRKFGLSEQALRKIDGAFRKPPGRKVLNFYANLPDVQTRFPLGLLPPGQRAASRIH